MPDKTDAKNSPRIRDKRKEVDALQAEVDALAIKGRAAGYAPPPYVAHPLADERGTNKAAALYGGITGFGGGLADEGEHGAYGHLGHVGGWGGPDYATMYAKQKAITREEIEAGREKLHDHFERAYLHDHQQAKLEFQQRLLQQMEELQVAREKKIRVDLEYERSVGKKEDILITTISKIPGYRIKDICGHVMGLGAFEEADEDDPEEHHLLGPHHARSTALNAMLGEAQVQRANAIIGFEWSTKPLSITRTKIMAQGTAVVLEKDGPAHCGECGTAKKQPKGGGGGGGGAGTGTGGDKGKAEQHDHLHSHEHDERGDHHHAAANPNASKQTQQQQQQGKKQKGQAQQQQQEGGGKKNKGKQQNATANNAAAAAGGGGMKGGGRGAKIDDAENDGEGQEKQQPDTDDDNESTGDGDDTDHSNSYKNNGKQKAQNKQQNQNQNQGGGGKNNKGGPKLNTMQQMIKLLTEAKIREDKASLEAKEKEKLLKFMEKYFDDKKYDKPEPSTSDWLRKIEQEIAERKKGGNSKDGKGGSGASTVGGWDNGSAQTTVTTGWGEPDDDKGKSNDNNKSRVETNWNDKNDSNKGKKGGKGQKQNSNSQSQASEQQTSTTTAWDSDVTGGDVAPILQTADVDNSDWGANEANPPAPSNSAWDEPASNGAPAAGGWN